MLQKQTVPALAVGLVLGVLVGMAVPYVTQKESISKQSPESKALIIYQSSISAEERATLEKNVLNPYLDLEVAVRGSRPEIVSIYKVGSVPNAVYSFDAYTSFDDVRPGYQFGYSPVKGSNPVRYVPWLPECATLDCRDVPESFRLKYPELIEQAKSKNN